MSVLVSSQVAMDDAQISDISLRVLSLLVQLFGGENKHSLDPENLVIILFQNLHTVFDNPELTSLGKS